VTATLLRRVAQGEPNASRACIEAFGGLVWTLARRASPTREDAEDAVQDIFLDLWRSASRYDPAVASETAFVATIARRRLVDRARARRRRPATDPLSSEPKVSTDAPPADRCIEATRAAAALEQLRPEQREVLLLSTQGFSHEEIAEQRGLPLGTVKAHARRGLIRVRALLVEAEVPDSTPPREVRP